MRVCALCALARTPNRMYVQRFALNRYPRAQVTSGAAPNAVKDNAARARLCFLERNCILSLILDKLHSASGLLWQLFSKNLRKSFSFRQYFSKTDDTWYWYRGQTIADCGCLQSCRSQTARNLEKIVLRCGDDFRAFRGFARFPRKIDLKVRKVKLFKKIHTSSGT